MTWLDGGNGWPGGASWYTQSTSGLTRIFAFVESVRLLKLGGGGGRTETTAYFLQIRNWSWGHKETSQKSPSIQTQKPKENGSQNSIKFAEHLASCILFSALLPRKRWRTSTRTGMGLWIKMSTLVSAACSPALLSHLGGILPPTRLATFSRCHF